MRAADVEFSRFLARKYGMRVFFDSCTPCNRSLDTFEGWELVAMPDGRVMDAVPLDAVPVPAMARGTFQLLEAFA